MRHDRSVGFLAFGSVEIAAQEDIAVRLGDADRDAIVDRLQHLDFLLVPVGTVDDSDVPDIKFGRSLVGCLGRDLRDEQFLREVGGIVGEFLRAVELSE